MTLALVEAAGAAAAKARGPEDALAALLAPVRAALCGEGEGAPASVAGAFMVAPDGAWHMLVAGLGFPPEQRRLMIPIEAGHPGRVRRAGTPLHLRDTEAEPGAFKQYLKTARMGSAIYVPMLWQGRFTGQIVLAMRPRGALGEDAFALMRALGPPAAALWQAQGGPAWLEAAYPPPDAFRVSPEGY